MMETAFQALPKYSTLAFEKTAEAGSLLSPSASTSSPKARHLRGVHPVPGRKS
jgi:hypothetical protein